MSLKNLKKTSHGSQDIQEKTQDMRNVGGNKIHQLTQLNSTTYIVPCLTRKVTEITRHLVYVSMCYKVHEFICPFVQGS